MLESVRSLARKSDISDATYAALLYQHNYWEARRLNPGTVKPVRLSQSENKWREATSILDFKNGRFLQPIEFRC